MQVKSSIRWQMVVVIGGMVFTSFLLFSMLVRSILIDDYRQLMKKNDQQLLQIMSYNITKSIAKPIGLVHLVAIHPGLMQLDESAKLNFISQTLKEDYSFEALSIINFSDNKMTPPTQIAKNLDLQYKDLVGKDGLGVSPIHYSHLTTNDVSLTFIHNIEENGQPVGAVISDINLKNTRDKIMEYMKNHQISLYLLDQDGTSIAQPAKFGTSLLNYYTMKKIELQKNHNDTVLKDEKGQLIVKEKVFTVSKEFFEAIQNVKSGNSGEVEYYDEEVKYFCVYQPVDLPLMEKHWSILLVHSESDMTALIDKLFVKALIAGFIMLIFVSFTIIYYSEKVTKPIFQIVEMANRVRAGDLSGQLNIKLDNEIGLLAENINHMIHGLRATRRRTSETEKQIKAIAYHDTLTGLPNRMYFLIYLREMLDKSVKGRFYGALLFIDVDKFKLVNDNYGHAVGDGLLIAFAKRIVEIAGRKEIVCRFGGDEFLLFLPGYDFNDTKSVCERLVKTMREPFNISGNEFELSTSIGAALFPTDADNIDNLMEKADAALYVSKRNGRDQYNFYAEGMETVPIDERD